MHLSNIEIRNFQGIKNANLTLPSSTTLLLGRNGAGKSTILRAVQHVLTGQTFDQQPRRMKAGELIGPDGRQAAVSLTLDGYEFKAVIRDSGTTLTAQNGKQNFQGRPDEVRNAVWNALGVSPALMPVVCHPRTFIISSELSKLLAELGGGIDQDALLEWAGEHGQWLGRFLAEANLTVNQPADLASVGKAVDAVRRDLNRDLKRLNETQPVDAPLGRDGKPITPAGKEQVMNQLSELRNKRDTLLRQIGSAEHGRTQEQIDAETEQVRAALAAMKKPSASGAAEKLQSVSQQHAAAAHQEATIRQERDSWKRLLGQSAAACPSCKRPFADADKAMIDAHIADAEERHAACVAECAALLAKMEPLRNKANAEKSALEQYEHAFARQNQRLQHLGAEQPAQDVTALQAEVDVLAQRIERGEAIVRQIDDYAAYQAAVQERDYIAGQIEHLNWAVEAFRDGAAAAALCRAGEAEFLQRLQSVMPGAAVSQLDGDTVLQIPRHGRMVPARNCSTGELCRLQTALIRAFGCGFGIVDGYDALDGDVKPELLRATMEPSGGYLLAAAWGIPGEPSGDIATALSPATVVWVDGENTRVMSCTK